MARKSLIEQGSILPGPDTLSRVIARDRDQSGRQAPSAEQHFAPLVETTEDREQASQQDNTQSYQSYDNMTNKLSDKQPTSQSSQLTDKQADQKENLRQSQSVSQVERKPISKKSNRIDAQPASLSVADLIRQRSAVHTAPEVLKTVTLKVSPSLDEKIERYCFENKMKKQQFWADAAALYFETVEVVEGE